MLQRMFGRRRLSPELKEGEDDDYVVIGAASSTPDLVSNYSLEGATAFVGEGPRRASSVSRLPSIEDPLSGVPFRVTVDTNGQVAGEDLALAVTARIAATDWDAYEYDFKLEQSILEECNAKLQNASLDIISGHSLS